MQANARPKTSLTQSGAFALALLSGGCAVVTATPPQVEVQQVEVQQVGLLDLTLGVTLCVSNPNNSELDFRQVTAALDLAGAPLAAGVSATPVRLPPRSSTLVPFEVAATAGNLGQQLLGVLHSGGVDYRLHGEVQLDGALAVTLPFSHAGRFDLLNAGQSLLADAVAQGGTHCAD